MVLSEAIRLGATLGPQIKGSFIGPDGATCTLGAALLAIGIKDNNAVDLSVFPSLVKEMPELRDIKAGLSGYLFEVIGRLSDQKGWTREQIADWIVANGYDSEYVTRTTSHSEETTDIKELVAVA